MSSASGLVVEMAAKALKLNIPLSVQLDLTYRCNERCIHCYLDHDDHGEMTTAEIKDLLDQMAEAGVFYLTISGGEILMRRDFFEILEYARARTFCINLKTNGVLIREKEAQRLRELGVERVQISVYSHRAEVHDAITKMPGSFRQSIAAVRFLRAQGLRVTMANVLMTQNASDYQSVKALAEELDARFIIDPTITPMMDGDRSILGLNVDQAALQRSIPGRRTGRKRRGILRSPAGRRLRSTGHAALQRRPHGLLRLSVRGCVSLRPVPSSQRQRAAHQVCGYLARFAAAQRSPVHHAAGHALVLPMHARRDLHALPRLGLPRRKYARAFFPGL